MRLGLRVFGGEDLSVGSVVDFVSGLGDVGLVVFHCSFVDDGFLRDFAEGLVEGLSVPFLGVRVSASLTCEGFFEDSVVVAVFSGDVDVELGCMGLDWGDVDGCVDELNDKLSSEGVCVLYSSCFLRETVYLDYLLRHVNLKKPGLQFTGCVSSPAPIVFSNDGVFEKGLVWAVFHGVDHESHIWSGLEFQRDSGSFTVTKSTPFLIEEVEDVAASDFYCGLKHVKPYFINTIVSYAARPQIHKVFRKLSEASEGLYEVVLKSTFDLMGVESTPGLVEVKFILNFQEDSGYWLTQSHTPEGTKLRWIENNAEKQIKIYDQLNEFPNDCIILGNECAYRLFWMNFRIKDIIQKTKKNKNPLLISYSYGEIGAKTPYTDLGQSVVHAGVLQVTGLRS